MKVSPFKQYSISKDKMDSSFHLSDIDQPNSPNINLRFNADANLEYNDEDGEDSVEFLRSKIEEVEATLESVNQDIERRQSMYEAELTGLAIEIKKAKQKSIDALEQQQIEQQNKFQELKFMAEDEKNRIEGYYNNLVNQNNLLLKNQREFMEIQQQSSMYDSKRNEELETLKLNETNAALQSTQFKKFVEKKLTQFSNRQRLRNLEQEVSNLQSTRREVDSKFRLDRSDLLGKFEIHVADNKMVISNLKNDIIAREKEFNAHLNATKQRIEKERLAAENELKFMATQLETLQNVYQTVLKRGSQQLSILNQDIEKMKRLLSSSREDVERYDQENLQRTKKFHELTMNTNSFRQSSSGIAEELSKTKMERDLSISQIQKYSTPNRTRKPPTSGYSYSYSTGNKISIF